MASGQNQGMQIALIIFVILTVLSMGFAVFTGTDRRELINKFETERKSAAAAEESFNGVQQELNTVKGLIGLKSADTGEMPDQAATEAFFKNDLKKYGERLKAIESEAVTPVGYSQALDAALTVLEQRNVALEAEKVKGAELEKQKAALEGTYQAQVEQFKTQAEAAEKARAEAAGKIDAVEKDAQRQKEIVVSTQSKAAEDLQKQRADMQKQIDDLTQKLTNVESALKQKDEYINTNIKTIDFAATYDGRVTRVIPATRTVWINLGHYDNLHKHLTFSVQPEGVPPGSKTKPKGKIEVLQILDGHLAECRILEDDLSNPILIGDNIFTSLWEPGQRTRFAFAGKIDLDGDGTNDIDRVRALVDRAGGQIDAVIAPNGEAQGELTIDTRYLVLGPLPAEKAGIDAYGTVLTKAESLGVQRVPVAIFLDQIGYKRDSSKLVRFGAGSAASTAVEDAPDGGRPVSTGEVSDLFRRRRPPAAAGGSAY